MRLLQIRINSFVSKSAHDASSVNLISFLKIIPNTTFSGHIEDSFTISAVIYQLSSDYHFYILLIANLKRFK